MSEKEIFGFLSVALSLVGHGAYYWSVWRWRTKPHVFTWTIWGLITGIAFFAQISKDAGSGSWAMGATSLACFGGAVLGLFWGEKDIRKSDMIAFFGALSAIPIWYYTKDALNAVIVVIIVEIFAFYPTFRKSYSKPHEELAFSYIVDILKYIISILAMEQYSLTTTLYPLFIIVIQSLFVFMLFYRRAALARVTK
jgi:hypothetical protein